MSDKPLTSVSNVPLVIAPQTTPNKPMIDIVTPSGKK